MRYEVAAGAEHEVVADRGGSGGGGDLAESTVVSGSRVAVVAELAALDVGHVAQEYEHTAVSGSRVAVEDGERRLANGEPADDQQRPADGQRTTSGRLTAAAATSPGPPGARVGPASARWSR